MVNVAIPGGTGGVGRSILDAVHDTGKHKVIALSRKAPETQDLHKPVIAVDYTDVNAIARVFEENHIEVVISAIFMFDEKTRAAEVNCVQAAEKSKTTKRYIISNWGMDMPPEDLRMSMQNARLSVMNEISKTDLEWTQFYNGFFLDYYGMPYIDTYLHPVNFVVGMADKVAVIPGTGDEPFSLTYTKDLAKFVAAVLDLPKWEEKFCAYSEQTTWNSVVKRAEEVIGTKFKVVYDDVEKLQRGECTDMPTYGPDMPIETLRMLQTRFGLYIIHGLFTVPEHKALNSKFPEIKTTTVDEVLGLWKGN